MKFHLDHIVLNCHDVEKMLNFYCLVLELPAERLELFREGKVPFPSVRINRDTIIDLFPEKLWAAEPQGGKQSANLNHFCLTVAADAFIALQERLGRFKVAIEQGPVERWGAHGTGISIYFRDPESNLVEVRYYENGEGADSCLLQS